MIQTARLRLRRPTPADAPAIFDRYASDAEVTRYMSWPRHRTLSDTLAFLAFCEEEWSRTQFGTYLIESRETSCLLGSTGISIQPAGRGITGYILARDAWGRGFATEALTAMVELAREIKLVSLHASCHAQHRASAHVLEKCGFTPDHNAATLAHFPNDAAAPQPILAFKRQIE
ncbi:MAG TPA: GNAT family N-acetyltransferase [Terriglobales bacterium]|nr:GNAT family N-acetyltransferase [Terriglobales bacterium]